MLTFADNAWHVFSNVLTFGLGLWIAIAQKRIFRVSQKHAIFFYFWHSSFCLFYFYFSLNNIADAKGYYRNSLNYDQGFKFGTQGIEFLTSFFSSGLGFSYGGTFLVYNILGFIGMLAFASALQQTGGNSNRRNRLLMFVIILLPGVSFWSSPIGKDALTLMATGLACWASLDFSRRYPAVVITILAFLYARPHMAGIFLICLTFALLFTARLGLAKKAFLSALAIPAAIAGFIFGAQFAGLGDANSISDINDYFEQRQSLYLDQRSSVDLAGMPIPMRLMTFLFRPMFFDGLGLLGIVVSIENVVILLIVLFAVFHKIRGRKSQLNGFAIFFLMSFSIISWLVLGNSVTNLGLALRQKWMFLPMILLLSYSYLSRHRPK